MRNPGRKHERDIAISWIVLIPFLLFSLFAPGTMPSLSPDGVAVVLCTGDGPTTMMHGPDGAPVETKHQDCVWALHTHMSVLPTLIAPDARIAETRVADALQLASLWQGQTASHIYTARAPPFHV